MFGRNWQLVRSNARRYPGIPGSHQVANAESPFIAKSSRCSASSLQKNSDIRLGFVGLGNMGLPMALNILRRANEERGSLSVSSLVAFDTNAAACESLLAHHQKHETRVPNLEVVHSVSDLGAAGCNAIITMLPGCKAVNSVMLEIHKGLESTALPRTFIDCSTVSPTTSKHWHTFWEQQGHSMQDAPVSGGVKGATAGTLTFMVGSPYSRAEFDSSVVRPILQLMGQRIVLCGGPGTGAATKLCNNLALAAQMVGVCEALNLGEALGVDPVVLAQVMNTSTAACWSSQVNNPHPAVAASMDGDGPPAAHGYQGGFGSKLMLKDLGLAVAAAEDAGVSVPLTSVSKELYRLATLRGMGDKDFGVLLEFLKGK